jgi:hypothetical protein
MCAPDGTWSNQARDHTKEVHMPLVRSSPHVAEGVQVRFSPLARLALRLIVALAWCAQFRVAREAAMSKAAAGHCA